MNFNYLPTKSSDLNYLVVNYLKTLPSLSDNAKEEIIRQIETSLDYGIVYNTELTPYPSSYSLRKEMFNRLKHLELEDIVDEFDHFHKENEGLIRNENTVQANSAKCSMFNLMRQKKGEKIEKSTERYLQREALKRYQYMKSMLGHISFIDNTFVNPVPIYCVAYSENDEMIFTADNNGLIKIWSTQTGALVDIFKCHDKPINDILVLKNYLVSCSEDKSMIIWNISSLQLSKVYNFDESIVRVVSYQYKDANSGKEHNLIITSSLSGKIYFVDLDNAVQKRSPMQMELDDVDSFPVKFYFDKKIVDKYNLKKVKTMQQSCISANSKHGILICGYNDGLICVWDLKKILDDSIMNKRFIHEFDKYVLFLDYVHSSNVHISDFSLNNCNFFTGSIDGNVLIWKVLDDVLGRLRSNIKGALYECPIYSINKLCETEDRTRCAVNCSIWTKRSNFVIAMISSKKRKRGVDKPNDISRPQQAQQIADLPLQGAHQNNSHSPIQGDAHSNKRSSSIIVYSLMENRVIKRYCEANGFNFNDECFVLESHPQFEEVILTISETSDVILFNFLTGETLAKFRINNCFFTNAAQNVISSEGKFSSRGDSFVISTFLGFISIYSIYSPSSFSSTYMNQFISREFNANHSNEGVSLETIFPQFVNMFNLPQITNQPYSEMKLKQIESLRPMLQSKYNLTNKEIEHRFSRDNYENYDKNQSERVIECEKEENAFNQAIQDNMAYRLTDPVELPDLPDEEDNNNNEDDASDYSEQEEVVENDSYNDDRLSGDDQMLLDENRDNFIQPRNGGGNYSLRNRRNQTVSSNNQQANHSNNNEERIHTRSYDLHQQTGANPPLNQRSSESNRLRKRLRLRKTNNRLSLSGNRDSNGDNNENDSDIEYEKALNASLGRKKKTLKNRIDDSIQSRSDLNDEEEEDEKCMEDNEESSKAYPRLKKKEKRKAITSTTRTEILKKMTKDGQSHQCFFCKFYSLSVFGPFYLSQSEKVSLTQPLTEPSEDIYFDMNCLFNYNDYIIFNTNDKFDFIKTIEEIIRSNIICYRCNSPYATKKCSDENCLRYFHGNYCLIKLCIDYSNAFETENNFTQCLTCYRRNFAEELVTTSNPVALEMQKVPKNFFLSENLSQSSFFPQKSEIVYFILQGYEVFLNANFEYLLYELPTNDNSLYDEIYFWKERTVSKGKGNKTSIDYHVPFKCQIEEIEYAFLSDKSLMLIEKMYGKANIIEKMKIIIKMQLNILETKRKIKIVFCENEQPDFLIREKLYENNYQLYLDKLSSNDLNVQMLIDNEISDAVIMKQGVKENNNAYGLSFYENMSIHYIPSNNFISNASNNHINSNNDLMEISFWDLFDSKFTLGNPSLKALCTKMSIQIGKLMSKNEDNLYIFFDCVDETRDNAVNYYNIVPVPMYLSLIKERLKNGYYLTIDSIKYDYELILQNALKYNTEQSVIVKNAQILVKRISNILNDFLKDNLKDSLVENNKESLTLANSVQLLGKKKKRIHYELGLDSLGFDEDDFLFDQRSLRKRVKVVNNKDSSDFKLPISIHTTSSKTDKSKREMIDDEIAQEIIENDAEMKKSEISKALRPRNKFKLNNHH